MADLSDVETALVSAARTALYPSGFAGASVTGGTIRVFRGWPSAGALAEDLGAGIANVSVFPVPDDTRITTRWGVLASSTAMLPALTVTVDGTDVSFGGMATPGQLAGILVDGKAYVHRTIIGDSPALIAAILADAIRADRVCATSGATVSIPGAAQLIARVVADAAVLREWDRLEQGFRVTVWAPDPSTRDLVCGTLSRAWTQVAFLDLADGTAGRLRYRRTASHDDAQDAHVYRRDLVYGVEYPTTIATLEPAMLFGDVVLDGAMHFG